MRQATWTVKSHTLFAVNRQVLSNTSHGNRSLDPSAANGPHPSAAARSDRGETRQRCGLGRTAQSSKVSGCFRFQFAWDVMWLTIIGLGSLAQSQNLSLD